jgi:hypothetical protein
MDQDTDRLLKAAELKEEDGGVEGNDDRTCLVFCFGLVFVFLVLFLGFVFLLVFLEGFLVFVAPFEPP